MISSDQTPPGQNLMWRPRIVRYISPHLPIRGVLQSSPSPGLGLVIFMCRLDLIQYFCKMFRLEAKETWERVDQNLKARIQPYEIKHFSPEETDMVVFVSFTGARHLLRYIGTSNSALDYLTLCFASHFKCRGKQPRQHRDGSSRPTAGAGAGPGLSRCSRCSSGPGSRPNRKSSY